VNARWKSRDVAQVDVAVGIEIGDRSRVIGVEELSPGRSRRGA
jgi:hypothetical protein